MRSRTLLVALAGLAVVVAAGAVVLWPREDRLTLENYQSIEYGMSRDQVLAILGPPGDHRTGPTYLPMPNQPLSDTTCNWLAIESMHQGYPWWSPEREDLFWNGDECDIWVCVGSKGVKAMDYTSMEKVAQSPLDTLLWRLKRQWHRWFP